MSPDGVSRLLGVEAEGGPGHYWLGHLAAIGTRSFVTQASRRQMLVFMEKNFKIKFRQATSPAMSR